MDFELIRQSINRAKALAKELGLDMDDIFTERYDELKRAFGNGNKN